MTYKLLLRVRVDACKNLLIPQSYVNPIRNQNTSTLWPPPSNSNSTLPKLLSEWMLRYEDFVGITGVKRAQNKVLEAEKKFQDTQESRRELQRQLQVLQSKLKDIHLELDKTSRGEDRYLHLITQEHAIIRDERTMLDVFRSLEKDERDYFSALSLAVRESHEEERTQAERTKYWSVIGSVCGAIIGIFGTTLNNRMRMKELRQLVTDATDTKDNSVLLAEQQTKMEGFLADVKKMLSKEEEKRMTVLNPTNQIASPEIEAMEKRLAKEMGEVKAMIAAQLLPTSKRLDESEVSSLRPVSVYFGEDLGHIVQAAEKNLEWKMKINSLATVAAFYGILAVVIPFLFRGN